MEEGARGTHGLIMEKSRRMGRERGEERAGGGSRGRATDLSDKRHACDLKTHTHKYVSKKR